MILPEIRELITECESTLGGLSGRSCAMRWRTLRTEPSGGRG